MTTKHPVLVYDGDCTFCKMSVHYAKSITGAKVDYEPYQKVASKYKSIPASDFKKAVQLIDRNGKVYSGAHAVYKTLAYGGGWIWRISVWKYKAIPGFPAFSEWMYQFVAKRRPFFAKLARFGFGQEPEKASFFTVRTLFMKMLAVIYLIAFSSLAVQILGLVGSEGILPVSNHLAGWLQRFGNQAYTLFPSIFWLNHSDAMLVGACLAGVLFSIFLFFGRIQKISLLVLFALYLSLLYAGQLFMSFQWDVLLLEVGFAALLFSFLPKAIWLLRWLLFRLTFMSGAVKLLSGDENWRSLRALDFHFETQPLPTGIAWYFHNLPSWMLTAGNAVMFFIQLIVPFFIFAPRHLRFTAGILIGFLELLILISGNYNFFNLLTLALCFALVDDQLIDHLMPKLKDKLKVRTKVPGRLIGGAIGLIAVFLGIMGVGQMIRGFGQFPTVLKPAYGIIAPYHIVNGYGLFARMTTERNEVVVQGSNDEGEEKEWLDYEFKYKPQDLERKPRWVAPHQPRLDWQLWFAAFGNYTNHPWFVNFAKTLLDGSPEVLLMLKHNPFPDAPPKYIRAVVYQYKFTTPEERERDGSWWKRRPVGLYMPQVSSDLFYRPERRVLKPVERHEP